MATNSVTVRFYAELNDFLPPDRSHESFQCTFEGRRSVKDLIESLGPPHTEVDLILVNGQSVDFSHRISDGDRVSVYPVFEAFDIASVTRVRAEPLREVRFLLDGHLGRLAGYLRLAGFDAAHLMDAQDRELARRAREERRILLTRDRGLLKPRDVTHGYWVRNTKPRCQLVEVLKRFDLARLVKPFTRCLECNDPLHEATSASVAERVPPAVRRLHTDFAACPACERIYWKGTHYDALQRLVDEAVDEAR